MPTRIIFALWMLLAAQIEAPWFGTWRLQSNSDRYKRVTSRIEPLPDGLKVIYDMVGARGGVTHMEWTGRFDGKDYPVQGVDYVLTNAYTLLTDHTYRIVVKVDGDVAATAKVEISPDGTTLTTETSEKTGVTTAVYKRQ